MPNHQDPRRSTRSPAALEIRTDVDGFVVEVLEAARTTFAVSPRTLQQRSMLSFFPGNHAQLHRQMVMVSLGHEAPLIEAMLYPRDRARVPVTIRLASPDPSTIVWSITRRGN